MNKLEWSNMFTVCERNWFSNLRLSFMLVIKFYPYDEMLCLRLRGNLLLRALCKRSTRASFFVCAYWLVLMKIWLKAMFYCNGVPHIPSIVYISMHCGVLGMSTWAQHITFTIPKSTNKIDANKSPTNGFLYTVGWNHIVAVFVLPLAWNWKNTYHIHFSKFYNDLHHNALFWTSRCFYWRCIIYCYWQNYHGELASSMA